MNTAEVRELLPHRATRTAAFRNTPAAAKRKKKNLLKSQNFKEGQKEDFLPRVKGTVPQYKMIRIYPERTCALWIFRQSFNMTILMERK